MLYDVVLYDYVVFVINVSAGSGLLYSALGQTTLALDSLNAAAKLQPQDYSVFLYRAKVYEKVLRNISHIFTCAAHGRVFSDITGYVCMHVCPQRPEDLTTSHIFVFISLTAATWSSCKPGYN